MQMRLTFIGADHEVTGSCHFLEVGNTKVLIDRNFLFLLCLCQVLVSG